MNELSSLHDDDDDESIDPSSIEQQVRAIVSASVSLSGPLPPPQILQGYEEVLLGSADRILAMAEQSQAHGHFMDRETLETERSYVAGMVSTARLRILVSTLVVITSLFVGAFVIWRIDLIAGTIIFALPSGLTGFSYLYDLVLRRARPIQPAQLEQSENNGPA